MEHRNKKLQEKSKGKKHKRKRHVVKGKCEVEGRHNKNKNGYEKTFKVPSVFSIENNTEETIKFFNSLINFRTSSKRKTNIKVYIDSSEVTIVHVSALMYLLAIINDDKFNNIRQWSFYGNYPENKNAKEVYDDSGFNEFVNAPKTKPINLKRKNVQIVCKRQNDSPTAGNVCKFVHKCCGIGTPETIPLYEILVELMGNTKSHAYEYEKNEDIYSKYWYLYAEDREDSVEFVFLDTGQGIPSTVQKRLREKIAFLRNDGEIIKSALNGDFRTRTLERKHGKGLPQIAQCFKDGLIKDVRIYSNKGYCYLDVNQSDYIAESLRNKIFGTLYSWKIVKERRV